MAEGKHVGLDSTEKQPVCDLVFKSIHYNFLHRVWIQGSKWEVGGNYFLKSPMILISCLSLWLRTVKFNIKQFSHRMYWHQGKLIPTYTREVLPYIACICC